jgi:hypothetical protein
LQLSGGAGRGSGNVYVSAAALTGLDNRTATLTIAGQTFTVTQTPDQTQCQFVFGIDGQYTDKDGWNFTRNIDYHANSGTISITANGSGCTWYVNGARLASCTDATCLASSWISVPQTSGSGSASLSYAVDANSAKSGYRQLILTVAPTGATPGISVGGVGGGAQEWITQTALANKVTLLTDLSGVVPRGPITIEIQAVSPLGNPIVSANMWVLNGLASSAAGHNWQQFVGTATSTPGVFAFAVDTSQTVNGQDVFPTYSEISFIAVDSEGINGGFFMDPPVQFAN